MNARHIFFLALLVSGLAVADQNDLAAIDGVLDDFHDAAAHGDKDRYLDLMTADSVFMGTDEWERWPKNPDFIDYVNGRFKNGAGWNYRSVDRNISLSDSGDVAWFDEVVFSDTNGRFRGTGILVQQDGEWKIAHYAMSFLIFNEDWPDVIELSKKTRAMKEQEASDQ